MVQINKMAMADLRGAPRALQNFEEYPFWDLCIRSEVEIYDLHASILMTISLMSKFLQQI